MCRALASIVAASAGALARRVLPATAARVSAEVTPARQRRLLTLVTPVAVVRSCLRAWVRTDAVMRFLPEPPTKVLPVGFGLRKLPGHAWLHPKGRSCRPVVIGSPALACQVGWHLAS